MRLGALLASDVNETVVGPVVRSGAAPVAEGDGLAVQRFSGGGEPLFGSSPDRVGLAVSLPGVRGVGQLGS